MNRIISLMLMLWFSVLFGASPVEAQVSAIAKMVKNGGFRVEDDSGQVLMRHRDTEAFIPASTLKVATAFCALEELGGDFRFKTRFFASPSRSGSSRFYIQGSGDPFMVSEELRGIAKEISDKISEIDEIIIDTSLFQSDLDIDGVSASTNPYDAKNAAFVGNFSSAQVTRSKSGRVTSAEPQTPLTPLAEKAGTRLPPGVSDRVNLGTDWRLGTLYGGELLAEFLRESRVSGDMRISLGRIPQESKEIYIHTSSKELTELVRGMLHYSTNFTANQVFLTLGLKKFGAPATVEKGQKAIAECLRTKVGWKAFHVEEGSGLSRKTKVTAQQMNALLQQFKPYKFLLKDQDGFIAKTGTLTGVNTLSGFFTTKRYGEVRFTVLINSQVAPLYKFSVAREIREALGGS